jgi:hypothetical protein
VSGHGNAIFARRGNGRLGKKLRVPCQSPLWKSMKPPTRTPIIVALAIAALYLVCVMAGMSSEVRAFGKMLFQRFSN